MGNRLVSVRMMSLVVATLVCMGCGPSEATKPTAALPTGKLDKESPMPAASPDITPVPADSASPAAEKAQASGEVATEAANSTAADKAPKSDEVSAEKGEKPGHVVRFAQKRSSSKSPSSAKAKTATPPVTVGQVPPAELLMPKVLMTEGHAATCKVKVGDMMPDIELPDLAGKPQSLAKLRGPKLTVVLLWTSSHPYAVEELADIGPVIVDPFAARGLAAVAIDVSDTPEVANKIAEQAGVKIPVLVDAQATALALVATKKLPRTYLLDATGKILWFDIEYSRSTRRDLLRAIEFTLSQP